MSRLVAPSRPYVTKQGDVVDAICKAAYGTEVGTTEIVLDFNPGLAARGAVLEEGFTILLPVLSPKPRVVKATRQLWQ